MKSRLPKRKAWDGSKMGGTRIPAGEGTGDSIEPRRIVSPEPATVGVAENGPSDDQKVLNVQRLPHGWRKLSVKKVTN